jgi:hypothetical protein
MQLGTDLERLVDEVARLAGESRSEAVRRALEERRDRLAGRQGIPETDVAARLAALDALRDSLALTPEAADAWVREVAEERRANHPPGAEG